MNNLEFAQKLENIAKNYKTLYVMGCFGAPMTATNKKRYCNNHSYNKKTARTKKIQAATASTFGFDCVGLIKGVLWGWSGKKAKVYGGAAYTSNNVPDIGADRMITKCSDISTNFSRIEVGEAVWMRGHIGVYIGDGLVVESSPKWADGVQITACNRKVAGYNRRNWTKHGKLPYIEYIDTRKSVVEIAQEVLDGKWYNGAARKAALTKAGYDYAEVQKCVGALLAEKKLDTVAREVVDGKWGNGAARKSALTKAGYDYAEIQNRVNKLLKK